jgi:putative acetyltransferase
VRIRPERPADAAAIDALHLAAFGDPQLPPLVAAIRASEGYLPELALVAEAVVDGKGRDADALVGHVMVSRTLLERDDATTAPVLLLSPLGVAPARQRTGVGSALMRTVLRIADERAEPLLIVEGIPAYYPRFGFVRGRTIGVLPPEHLRDLDAPWMARRLPSWTAADRGRVVYPSPVHALDT